MLINLQTNTFKTISKRAIQKTAEATGDLVGNIVAVRITKVSKKSQQNNSETVKEIPNEKYISPEERQKTVDDPTLI